MGVDGGPLMTVGRVRLAGGYHNDVYRVRSGARTLVEKHYATPHGPNPMYPNLPEQEALALQVLAPTERAPRFVSFRGAAGQERAVLTYEFVRGREWSRGVSDVARLLHDVHRAPVDRRLRRLLATPADVLAHADAMVDDVPVRMSAALRAVRPRLESAALRSRADSESIVHTDCGPGNVIRGGRLGLVLIDWQCPGRGDPTEDVACFRSPAMMILYGKPILSPVTAQRFLDAYAELSEFGAATVRRHAAVGSAWHYRIAAYCIWRAHELRRSAPEVAARYRRALGAEIDLLEGWT